MTTPSASAGPAFVGGRLSSRSSAAPALMWDRLSSRSGAGPVYRRRGVVLILVVAVLGILFVAGAALLNTVTFSTKTIDAAKSDRENRAAVEAIDSLAIELLEAGFLNSSGRPYSPVEINARGGFPASMSSDERRARWAAFGTVLTPDDPAALDLSSTQPTETTWRVTLPTYGEIPGVHMWIDLTEPEEATDSGSDFCQIRLYSNLQYARERRARVDPRFRATQYVVNEPVSQPVLGRDYLPNIALSALPTTALGDPYVRPEVVQDSDGDGVPDTYAFRVSADMLSPELQRRLADRLRDPLTLKAGSPELDAIWVSMRIVPHGAMVNVNTRMPVCEPPYADVLLASILGYQPEFFDSELPPNVFQAPFLPLTEEAGLRNRGGCVVARSRQLTNLTTALTMELFGPHGVGAGTLSSTQLQSSVFRRWWPYDASTLATKSNSEWRQLMDPTSGVGAYDLNHVLTTVSYSDQLIRSGTGPDPLNNQEPHLDWIDRMKNAGTNAFAWVNYPAQLPIGDVRRGRLKFSFPYFSKPWSMGGYWQNNGLQFHDPLDPQRRELIHIAQDAFALLLRNYVGFVDFDHDGAIAPPYAGAAGSGDDVGLSVLAASLAANLVDFADADDLPTPVEVRDWRTGAPITDSDGVPLRVFGFERQPFITEVYAKVGAAGPAENPQPDPTNTAFAIELYNPYEVPLDLTGYIVTDVSEDAFESPLTNVAARLRDIDIDERRLDGQVIPPRSFLVLAHPFYQPTDLEGTEVEFGDDTSGGRVWAVDHLSRIQLVRNVGGVEVVVDEFNVAVDTWRGVGVPQQGWTPTQLMATTAASGPVTIELAWERDTTFNGEGVSNWRFVVPRAAERLNRTPGHTLGLPSEYDSALDVDANGLPDPIRSVHLDVSNIGTLRDAFPTTGSLLLLTRHAHVVMNPAVPGIPFNRAQNGAMALEYFKIDNGRLPVFDEPIRRDVDGKVRRMHRVLPTNQPGAHQGVEALPWGQLIFDYFTALPLDYEDPCMPGYALDHPPVDQNGLRVAGRINLNAAPWTVIAGLPMRPMEKFIGLPPALQVKVRRALFENSRRPMRYWDTGVSSIGQHDEHPADIGREIAQSIVAYRDARLVVPAANDPEVVGDPPSFDTPVHNPIAQSFQELRGPTSSANRRFRAGYGFLTVGELLNVRLQTNAYQPPLWVYSMDGGELLKPPMEGDYVRAVARMVTLGEWVTTKSHVFTVYGTIRGQFVKPDSGPDALRNSLQAVNQRAIRFQTTIDRLPMLFGQPAQRLGARVIGNYADVRSE